MATPRKKAEPKKAPEETPKEAPKKTAKQKRYAGIKFSFYHPFQQKQIPFGGEGVTLDMDSWLECQIAAGHIKEV
ncbi:MAG: hypothetical protein ACWGQW_24035 [bacterium]